MKEGFAYSDRRGMPPVSECNDSVLVIYIIEGCMWVIWILNRNEQDVQETRETRT